MGKKIKAKVRYKKNNKAPKAFVGAATAAMGLGKAIYGGIQANRAKKAEKAFDKTRLDDQVSSATRKMADQPISQDLITGLKEQQGSNMASSMSALSKDPRNALAGINALNRNANTQNLNLLDKQQIAKTNAMKNLATEQNRVKKQDIDVASSELKGIQEEKAAGVQNIFGGVEDVASGMGNIFSPSNTGIDAGMGYTGDTNNTTYISTLQEPTLNTDFNVASGGLKGRTVEKGGKIESEEGGVTPGEFDHDSNPIDMVQDGEKIGEATGGELILPPDDVEAVRSALKDGDKDAAFKLMEDLVAKYDENVIESKEEEKTPEVEQAPMMKRGGYLDKVKARMGAYMKSKY